MKSSQWPPTTDGYWELEEIYGLKHLEVSLRGLQPPRIKIPAGSQSIPGRLKPLLAVASAASWRLGGRFPQQKLSIQFHDECPNLTRCLHFDAALNSKAILLPDPYALASSGYRRLQEQLVLKPLPPWRERLPIAFWRGSSTGTHAITLTRLKNNLRYQLCKTSLEQPSLLDARITAIVQSRDEHAKTQIQKHLMQQGLMASNCPSWNFGLNRFLIEIDGNVNSWGLLWKLLTGSCILKVKSPRRQWYHHRLRPYTHFIPIAEDLSDLKLQLQWCLDNVDHCEYIAARGQAIAKEEVGKLGKRVLSAVDSLKYINE